MQILILAPIIFVDFILKSLAYTLFFDTFEYFLNFVLKATGGYRQVNNFIQADRQGMQWYGENTAASSVSESTVSRFWGTYSKLYLFPQSLRVWNLPPYSDNLP